MNWTTILQLLPVLLQAVQVAKSIGADRTSGSGLSVTDTIQKEAPAVVSIFQQIGQSLFPNVPAAQQTAAAAVVLDTDTTKKIQVALNSKGATPALVVDGAYGGLTKAAVSAFQKMNPPLVVDGWAGALTQRVLFS